MTTEKHSALKGFITFIVFLLIWYALCKAGIWNSYVLPSPVKVFDTMIQMLRDGELIKNIGISLRRIIIGFSISFAAAVIFGLCSVFFPKARPYWDHALNVLRHIPPLAMVPLLILWFGIGETPKITVIFLSAFFPMLFNTNAGLAGCDKKLIEVGYTLGMDKKKIFFRIMVPNAVPDILVGMRLGLGDSIRAIVGAEMIAASSGLGYLILDARDMSRTDKVIVGMIFIGLIGLVFDALFRLAINKASHGRRSIEG